MFSGAEMMAPQLKQHQREQEAAVAAMVAMAAANRVLQYGHVLHVAEAEAGEPEFSAAAARAHHSVHDTSIAGENPQPVPRKSYCCSFARGVT